MKQLLRIGDFASLGRVSNKTLRFYEEQGLLKPEYVDPGTGYRYYRTAQSAQLAQITNLRTAGFGISEIAALLRSGLSARALAGPIAAKRSQLLDEKAAIDERLRIVEALSRSLDTHSERALSTVKLTAVSPQRVHSVSKRVPGPGESVTEMFERAEAEVAARNARLACAPFLIYHDPPGKKKDLEVEVCIPVTEESRTQLDSTVIPGYALACTAVYGGHYGQTEELLDRMVTWIASAGLRPGGPLREIYHRFGADQEEYKLPGKMLAKSADQFLTELLLPLAAA